MNLPSFDSEVLMKSLDSVLAEAGVYSWACLRAEPVEAPARELYERWIAAGRHGSMDYMARYDEVRSDPRRLLTDDEGGPARSLLVSLFSYGSPDELPERSAPRIADYALGRDYHNVLRKQLRSALRLIEECSGYKGRICIDSAPLRERYWAARAGLGFVARNNQLTVPGVGAHFFIATIVTAAELPERLGPHRGAHCPDGCRVCLEACPTGALKADGSCDTRRCVAYLTTERHEPPEASLSLAGNIVGCDCCRRVCPIGAAKGIVPSAKAVPSVNAVDRCDIQQRDLYERARFDCQLSADQWLAMTEADFDARFAGSAVRRAGLRRIQDALRTPSNTPNQVDQA